MNANHAAECICKTIFTAKLSNIDKDKHRRPTSIQNTVQSDSLIALSQSSTSMPSAIDTRNALLAWEHLGKRSPAA